MPRLNVPSTPARRLYSSLNSMLCCSARCASIAMCSALGRNVSPLPARADLVQSVRTAHPRHVAATKCTWIASLPHAVCIGVQLLFCLPAGQVTFCASQSTAKQCGENPLPARVCQLLSSGIGPTNRTWCCTAPCSLLAVLHRHIRRQPGAPLVTGRALSAPGELALMLPHQWQWQW